jgi:DNA-binding response OmpR family regulator
MDVNVEKGKPLLLIADDEPKIRRLLIEILSKHFDIIEASNGKEVVELAQTRLPSMILLDLIMPEMDGFEACRMLRSDPATRSIPLVVLTAASEVGNRISLFNLGIDDFISKPFDTDELLARVTSRYKRFQVLRDTPTGFIRFANMTINANTGEVSIGLSKVLLNGYEFLLLKLFAENAGKVVTRDDIMKNIWKKEDADDRIIDAHIVSLRKKISAMDGTLKTIYGRGYMLMHNA